MPELKYTVRIESAGTGEEVARQLEVVTLAAERLQEMLDKVGGKASRLFGAEQTKEAKAQLDELAKYVKMVFGPSGVVITPQVNPDEIKRLRHRIDEISKSIKRVKGEKAPDYFARRRKEATERVVEEVRAETGFRLPLGESVPRVSAIVVPKETEDRMRVLAGLREQMLAAGYKQTYIDKISSDLLTVKSTKFDSLVRYAKAVVAEDVKQVRLSGVSQRLLESIVTGKGEIHRLSRGSVDAAVTQAQQERLAFENLNERIKQETQIYNLRRQLVRLGVPKEERERRIGALKELGGERFAGKFREELSNVQDLRARQVLVKEINAVLAKQPEIAEGIIAKEQNLAALNQTTLQSLLERLRARQAESSRVADTAKRQELLKEIESRMLALGVKRAEVTQRLGEIQAHGTAALQAENRELEKQLQKKKQVFTVETARRRLSRLGYTPERVAEITAGISEAPPTEQRIRLAEIQELISARKELNNLVRQYPDNRAAIANEEQLNSLSAEGVRTEAAKLRQYAETEKIRTRLLELYAREPDAVLREVGTVEELNRMDVDRLRLAEQRISTEMRAAQTTAQQVAGQERLRKIDEQRMQLMEELSSRMLTAGWKPIDVLQMRTRISGLPTGEVEKELQQVKKLVSARELLNRMIERYPSAAARITEGVALNELTREELTQTAQSIRSAGQRENVLTRIRVLREREPEIIARLTKKGEALEQIDLNRLRLIEQQATAESAIHRAVVSREQTERRSADNAVRRKQALESAERTILAITGDRKLTEQIVEMMAKSQTLQLEKQARAMEKVNLQRLRSRAVQQSARAALTDIRPEEFDPVQLRKITDEIAAQENGVMRMQLELRRMASTLRNFAFIGSAAFASLTRESVRFSLALTKLTQGYNLAAREAIVLVGIAESTGVSVDQLTTGIGNYFQKIITAGQGTSLVAARVREALAYVGIQAVRLGEQGMPAVTMLEKMRGVFQYLAKHPQERAYIGQQVFGGAYEQFLPLLQMSDEAYARIASRFAQFGTSFTQKDLQAVVDANAEMVALRMQFRMLGQDMLKALKPAFEFLVSRLQEIVDTLKNVKPWVKSLGATAGLFAVGGAFIGSQILEAVSVLQAFNLMMGEKKLAIPFLVGLQTALTTALRLVLSLSGAIWTVVAALGVMGARALKEQRAFAKQADFWATVGQTEAEATRLRIRMLEKTTSLTREQSAALTENKTNLDKHLKVLHANNTAIANRNWWNLKALMITPRLRRENEAHMAAIDRITDSVNRLAASIKMTRNEWEIFAKAGEKVNLYETIVTDETMTLQERLRAWIRRYQAQKKYYESIHLEMDQENEQAVTAMTRLEQDARNTISRIYSQALRKERPEADTSNIGNRLTAIREETSKAKAELQDAFRTAVEIIKKRDASSRVEIDNLFRMIVATDAEIAKKQKSLELFRSRWPERTDLHSKLESEIEELKKKRAEMEGEGTKLRHQIADTDEQIVALTRQRDAALEGLSRQEQSRIAERLAEITRQKNELQSRMASELSGEKQKFWAGLFRMAAPQVKMDYLEPFIASIVEAAQEARNQAMATLAATFPKEIINWTPEVRSLWNISVQQEDQKLSRTVAESIAQQYMELADSADRSYQERIAYTRAGEQKLAELHSKGIVALSEYLHWMELFRVKRDALSRELGLIDPFDLLIQNWEMALKRMGDSTAKMKKTVFDKILQTFSGFFSELLKSPNTFFRDWGKRMRDLWADIVASLAEDRFKREVARIFQEKGEITMAEVNKAWWSVGKAYQSMYYKGIVQSQTPPLPGEKAVTTPTPQEALTILWPTNVQLTPAAGDFQTLPESLKAQFMTLETFLRDIIRQEGFDEPEVLTRKVLYRLVFSPAENLRDQFSELEDVIIRELPSTDWLRIPIEDQLADMEQALSGLRKFRKDVQAELELLAQGGKNAADIYPEFIDWMKRQDPMRMRTIVRIPDWVKSDILLLNEQVRKWKSSIMDIRSAPAFPAGANVAGRVVEPTNIVQDEVQQRIVQSIVRPSGRKGELTTQVLRQIVQPPDDFQEPEKLVQPIQQAIIQAEVPGKLDVVTQTIRQVLMPAYIAPVVDMTQRIRQTVERAEMPRPTPLVQEILMKAGDIPQVVVEPNRVEYEVVGVVHPPKLPEIGDIKQIILQELVKAVVPDKLPDATQVINQVVHYADLPKRLENMYVHIYERLAEAYMPDTIRRQLLLTPVIGELDNRSAVLNISVDDMLNSLENLLTMMSQQFGEMVRSLQGMTTMPHATIAFPSVGNVVPGGMATSIDQSIHQENYFYGVTDTDEIVNRIIEKTNRAQALRRLRV